MLICGGQEVFWFADFHDCHDWQLDSYRSSLNKWFLMSLTI
jgi:hypothetical protein